MTFDSESLRFVNRTCQDTYRIKTTRILKHITTTEFAMT